MMARLLDEAPAANEGMCEASKAMGEASKVQGTARKLSFKTRQAAAARNNYRATKVSLTSSNVALIASKFNTIVIDDGAQGRALLRRLSGKQRKPSLSKEVKVRGEGVVKAAIEIFEHQDVDKTSGGKQPLKKGVDTRTKLVVLRRSSSKSSMKLEDLIKGDAASRASNESAKDSKCTEPIINSTTVTEIKDIKRKPSLKAKPVLTHNMVKKQTENSLNQRIAKFNSIDTNTNCSIKITPKAVNKPNFSLNERIAHYSKSDKEIISDDGKNKTTNINKAPSEVTNKLNILSEEKENKQEITKSILRNTKNKQPGLVEQTKDRLATIIQQNNTNHQNKTNSNFNTEKRNSLVKDKLIGGEMKVFNNMPDIIKSAGLKDDETNSRLSVPKDATLLDNVFIDSSSLTPKISQNTSRDSLQPCKDISSKKEQDLLNPLDKPDSREPATKQVSSITGLSNTNKGNKISSPSKDMYGSLKPAIKPYCSESPKLEKKTRCVASDPSENLQMSRMKPNNSFLWKPASKISVLTEVPIYDDRPESHTSDNVFEDSKNSSNNVIVSKETFGPEEDPKPVSSMDFDVSSSFILEMTEHIERRFSSGSLPEKDSDDKNIRASLEEVRENIILKNSSFLHGKSQQDDVLVSTSLSKNMVTKPDVVKTVKVPPPVGKKPVNLNVEDSPPQLPEKRPTGVGEFGKNLNLNAPPIPPSHTKPKLVNTISEETWLENCKKILEIPPPLRKRNAEGESTELTQTRKTPGIDQCRGMSDKRFSVSQVELLRRMSEMNLTNKRNSLPSDTFSVSSSYVEPEEDDHYTSIQHYQRKEIDDQDDYEAIGENNYAEIEEAEDANNIYDDVIGQEPEDHYEAISCELNQVQGDSDSSCDQSNSLYGLARPASLAASAAVYQVTGGSETSDEWVDMDNSDDHQQSVFIFREKDRARNQESWSMKVRRQWSRHTGDGDDGSEESVPRSYENIDETSYCDDFDDSFSDSSFDHEPVGPHAQVVEEEEKRPQPISEGIYGLMKQAGQRMRKHWPLGKTLTRMKKKKSSTSLQSTGSLGQRGWSFKSRDKPSSAQSTFYLHDTNTLPRTHSQSESKIDPRRLSTTSMARPTSPPPPPPPPRNSVDENSRRKSDLNSSNNSSGDNEGYIEGQRRLSRNGNSMWYIETSTDTASEHGSSQGSDLNLRFADEPLYQFYAATIAERTLSELVAEEADSDGYEEISTAQSPRPSALDLVSATHHRSLWCEVPQVRNSGVLDTLTLAQKKLQESKFEVMTSEASYFKSLTVLDKLFASCPLFSDENILSRDERKVLFGNVNTVRKCSERLLAALQSCWQDCILLQGICDVVHDHVKAHRDIYVKYCTSQISMDRTLKLLKQTNSNFSTVLTQLEMDSQCQSLTLYSFLMLPMQRITRLRLLIDTMLSLMDPSDTDFAPCQRTLDVLNRCVAECNEGARSQERLEEMVRLSKQLEFPPEMNIPILGEGNNRWLVRSGQVTQVNMDAKQTFSRRLSRTGPKFTIFLLTDLFLFTKKKSEESYLVVDHCQRNLVETRELRDFPGNIRFLLSVTLLENSDSKTVEMTLSCDSETERQRWLQALSSPQSEEPGETLYEGWDCPQVSAIHSYQPNQPDELLLAPGDIVNVLRKTEGWFFGERTRDGEKGWFPGNYTREIASKHVRARNLKQRHRLLQLSADFVQQQKKIKS